jgi:LmbE family N-acetylglucosaminyl deacetylase
MREAKPDVVITFDPIGGYRHPDHIHTHQATVKAFEYLQQHEPETAPKRLYFHLMPAGFLKAGILTLRLQGKDPRHYGDRGDIDLVDIANQGFPVHARVNYRKVADRQFNASRCHASQGGDSRGSGFQGFLVKLLSRPIDTFMQAYPQPNEGVLRHSLIEGLS